MDWAVSSALRETVEPLWTVVCEVLSSEQGKFSEICAANVGAC